MTLTLDDRLSTARHRQFVGRSTELDLFQSALTSADLPFHVLFVFGPGGIGKTALLREFALAAGRFQLPVTSLDGRKIEATPETFLTALRLALGLASTDSPLQFLAAPSRAHVLILDTYEELAPLDTWR